MFTEVIYIAYTAPGLYTVSTTIWKPEIMDKSKKIRTFLQYTDFFFFFTTISLRSTACYFYWISITCFCVCLHHWQWKAYASSLQLRRLHVIGSYGYHIVRFHASYPHSDSMASSFCLKMRITRR
jgi:hypothetical protein